MRVAVFSAAVAMLLLAVVPMTRGQTGTQAPPATPQPPKVVLKELTDTIPNLPQHEVRIVTATLPPGIAGGWHKHSAPVYVYLAEGIAALELEDGTRHEFQAGAAVIEKADTVMRTVNRSATEAAVFITFQVSDPKLPFSEPARQ